MLKKLVKPCRRTKPKKKKKKLLKLAFARFREPLPHSEFKSDFPSFFEFQDQNVDSIWIDYDELFLWNDWTTKDVKTYFQPGPLSKILTTADLRHVTSRIWICRELGIKHYWMSLCSSYNHCITATHTLFKCHFSRRGSNLKRFFIQETKIHMLHFYVPWRRDY